MAESLAPFRKQIDTLDDQIVDLLGKRFQIVRHVAAVKECDGLDVVQTGRVEEVKNRNAERGKEVDLDPDFIHRLYDLIIDYAHQVEGKLIDERSPIENK